MDQGVVFGSFGQAERGVTGVGPYLHGGDEACDKTFSVSVLADGRTAYGDARD